MTTRDEITVRNGPQTAYSPISLEQRRENEAREAWAHTSGNSVPTPLLLKRLKKDWYTSPLTLSHQKIVSTCGPLEDVYIFVSSQNYDPRTVEYYRRELLVCSDYVMTEVDKACGVQLAQNAIQVDKRQKTGLIETPELRNCLSSLPKAFNYQAPQLYYNPQTTLKTKLEALEARARSIQQKRK